MSGRVDPLTHRGRSLIDIKPGAIRPNPDRAKGASNRPPPQRSLGYQIEIKSKKRLQTGALH
jgi:hypothetical protein